MNGNNHPPLRFAFVFQFMVLVSQEEFTNAVLKNKVFNRSITKLNYLSSNFLIISPTFRFYFLKLVAVFVKNNFEMRFLSVFICFQNNIFSLLAIKLANTKKI